MAAGLNLDFRPSLILSVENKEALSDRLIKIKEAI